MSELSGPVRACPGTSSGTVMPPAAVARTYRPIVIARSSWPLPQHSRYGSAMMSDALTRSAVSWTFVKPV